MKNQDVCSQFLSYLNSRLYLGNMAIITSSGGDSCANSDILSLAHFKKNILELISEYKTVALVNCDINQLKDILSILCLNQELENLIVATTGTTTNTSYQDQQKYLNDCKEMVSKLSNNLFSKYSMENTAGKSVSALVKHRSFKRR
ncbi:MAG: hypothetical protein Q4G04_02135 [bacterium]|nr:hypothetical protein [bacterium]